MIRLTPGDKAFYGMLSELARLLSSSCSLLTDLCEHPDQHDPLVRLIREDETAADLLTQQVSLRLNTSFIPALDANEIYDLARALDGTIDIVEDAATRVEAFRLTDLDERMRQLAAIVLQCSLVVEAGVAKLESPAEMVIDIGQCWRLEEDGDAIYAEAIRELFAGEPDPMDVLKRKEMYDLLEGAIDRNTVVAKVLTGIAVKRL
jgi:uncharacterized protein